MGIKPCCCGRPAATWATPGSHDRWTDCGCRFCGLWITHIHRETAIKLWNRRKP